MKELSRQVQYRMGLRPFDGGPPAKERCRTPTRIARERGHRTAGERRACSSSQAASRGCGEAANHRQRNGLNCGLRCYRSPRCTSFQGNLAVGIHAVCANSWICISAIGNYTHPVSRLSGWSQCCRSMLARSAHFNGVIYPDPFHVKETSGYSTPQEVLDSRLERGV